MLKIGEFSKLSQITVKAIRFYEKEGLLIPASVDEWTGYRFYNTEQLETAARIKSYRQLGLNGEEEVWAVNMKAEQNEIPALIDRKSIFPAWHMNKKHWITVLLTAATDFEKLCELTAKSYELVQR